MTTTLHASASRPADGHPAPLRIGQFRKVAGNGFGDGQNSYAYCSAWYDDHLYIGTNRNLLLLIKKRFKFEVPLANWPVADPPDWSVENQRAEIWRYHPPTDKWERVYQSPITRGLQDQNVPLAAGFRNMAVFQGRSDTRPAIYTIPSCGSSGRGPVLLHSANGTTFEQIGEPGMGLGDPDVTSFRAVIPFKGRLFVTPAGSRGFNPNVSYNALILCSDDPLAGKWEISCPRGFGDPTNVSIHDMAVCGNYLYAGTMNIQGGFQVWKTDAEGPAPHRWTRVLDRGADRGPFNQAVVCMAAFRGDLYIGTGIQNGGHDRINNIGPAAGEVLRVHPDDSWDLVVGDPRFTRQGLKIPLSGLATGFDNPFAGYIWRMCAHEGVLYVGTFDSSSFLPFANLNEQARKLLDPQTIARFLQARGGAELWRSANGADWAPVTVNGFGNAYNFGMRTVISTPRGLFVGTANPFGPRVAVRGVKGVRYEHNPDGGIEVWHGSREHDQVENTRRTTSDHRADALRLSLELNGERRVEVAHFGTDLDPRREHLNRLAAVLEHRGNGAELTDVRLQFGGNRDAHCAADLEMGLLGDYLLDPLLQLAVTKDSQPTAEHISEDLDEYFGGPMRHVGIWSRPADPPLLACMTLIDELAEWIPAPGTAGANTSLLVVATGLPAIIQRLLQRRADLQITGVCLDTESTKAGRMLDDRVRIIRAPRGGLAPRGATFDAVLWIEGPTGDKRRERLRQAFAALRPGGRLIASDLLGVPTSRIPSTPLDAGSAAAIGSYEQDLQASGFHRPEIIDVTRPGWMSFHGHSRTFFGLKMLFHEIDQDRQKDILEALPGGGMMVEAHVLVSAFKGEG